MTRHQRSSSPTIAFLCTLLAASLTLAPPAAALDIPVGEQYQLTFYGFLNPAVTWDSRGSKGVDWAFASPNS
ncbi:MAG: hypothetical protein HY574_04035, partial [candidate division NC10 bacterium]|nr:hypothetical protein [candidate division NC10 bacterium]